MFVPFMQYGCGGLDFNVERVRAYLANAGTVCAGYNFRLVDAYLCECETARWDPLAYYQSGAWQTLEYTYTSPAADPAPWYDADVIGSDRFLGYIVESAVGLTDSTVKRDLVPKISGSGGGVFGPYHQHPREVDITLLMFACDDVGMEVGWRFLKDTLGYWACEQCETCALTFATTCQTVVQDASLQENLLVGRWTLYDVSLVEGPYMDDDPLPGLGCNVKRVKFRIGAANPFLYKCSTSQDYVDYQTRLHTYTCGTGAEPNFVAGTEVSAGRAVSEPLNVGETCINVQVTNPTDPAYNVTISLIPDPFSFLESPLTAPAGWETPDPCAQVIVSYMPAGSKFLIDSVNNTYTMTLSDGTVEDGMAYISVEPGTIPSFLTVRCGTYWIEVSGEATDIPCDLYFGHQTTHREL